MDIRIVLVRTRNPLHIGAAARAMANFGLSDLAVVRPYAVAWREARSAVGATHVLRQARKVSLIEAVRDCHLVLGATAGRKRTLIQPLISLPDFREYIKERLHPPVPACRQAGGEAGSGGGRVAILFGSEKTGLTNREFEHCHALVRIPTDSETPSMNLAQAVAIIAYELARAREVSETRIPGFALPTQKQIEDLVERTQRVLGRVDYMQHMPEDTQREKLRRAFKRWRLTLADAALLQGIFKRVFGKLEEGLVSR